MSKDGKKSTSKRARQAAAPRVPRKPITPYEHDGIVFASYQASLEIEPEGTIAAMRKWLTHIEGQVQAEDQSKARDAKRELLSVWLTAVVDHPHMWTFAGSEPLARASALTLEALAPEDKSAMTVVASQAQTRLDSLGPGNHLSALIREELALYPLYLGRTLRLRGRRSPIETQTFVAIMDSSHYLPTPQHADPPSSPDAKAFHDKEISRLILVVRRNLSEMLPRCSDALAAVTDAELINILLLWGDTKTGPKQAVPKWDKIAIFAKKLGLFVSPDALKKAAMSWRKYVDSREQLDSGNA